MRTQTARIAAYAAAFFVATALTISFTRYSGGLALFWPGTAIAAALLLTLPYRNWPVPACILAVCSMVATALFGFGPGPAVPLAVVNICEAVLTAYFLRALRPQGDYVDSGAGILALVGIAGIAVPTLVSLPGSFIALQTVGGTWFGHAISWIVGHGLGALLVMPIALIVGRMKSGKAAAPVPPRRTAELLAVMCLVGGTSVVAIFQTRYPLLFLPMVPLVLASFRFGRVGGAVGVLVVTAIAALSLVMEIGQFAALDLAIGGKALFLQFYLAVLLLIALPLAVALKQRKRLLNDVVHREALQRLIADHSDDALLHLDGEGLIRFASPASEGLSGHADLIGRHLAAFFGAFDEEVVNEALAAARFAPGSTRIIERSITRGHATLWLEAKIRAVYSAGAVRSYVVTVRDVTARKLDELQAAREARTDALTGLPNRRAFLDVIECQLAGAGEEPFVLALVDLDHFKRVNDTHGHDTGDAVLKKIAGLMREHTTRDCFFARLGGEEFGMIARGDAADTALATCEMLRQAIEREPMIDQNGASFTVTASIGVARIAETCSPSMAMHAADGPLYGAKASGRNAVRLSQREGAWPQDGAAAKAEPDRLPKAVGSAA